MRKQVADVVSKLKPELRAQILIHYKGVMSIEEHKMSDWNTFSLVFQRAYQEGGSFDLDGKAYPDLSIVGGFQQWKRAGRRVKKGEHALYLSIPCMRGKAKPEDGAMILPADLGKIEERENSPYFKFVPVFDISQTEPIDAGENAIPAGRFQLTGETIEAEAVAI